MAGPVPVIYQKKNSRFQIDSCAPQIRAMRGGKIKLHGISHGHYPGTHLHRSQLPGVSSLGFWDGVNTQNWGLDPHRNEGIEICYLETGAMAFSVEDHPYELQSGDVTLTRPWQLHKLGAPHIGPGKLHWLILDVGVRRPNQDWRWPDWLTLTKADQTVLTRKLRHNENAVWKSSPVLASAFCGLSECVIQWGNPYTESRILTLLNQLLLEILLILTHQNMGENPELVSRQHTVKLFLHDLAKNELSSCEPWTLKKMACHCGMGVTAFSQYCRELVNCGAVDYLNQCRLNHAARQLREFPLLPITEIAFNHGFNSSQYFATVFREKFHCTPREYRLR